MMYRFVRGDGRTWRVTTVNYRYRLAIAGQDIWRMHWHPGGSSDISYPHLHARFDGAPVGANMIKQHLPMDRATLEQAIRWAEQCGYPMARQDWGTVLASAESEHLRHRSWEGTTPPAQPAGGSPSQ